MAATATARPVFVSVGWTATWTLLSAELANVVAQQETIIPWARAHAARLGNTACAGHFQVQAEDIHVFGSRLHGICFPNSDLDLVMHLPPTREAKVLWDRVLATLYEHMRAVN